MLIRRRNSTVDELKRSLTAPPRPSLLQRALRLLSRRKRQRGELETRRAESASGEQQNNIWGSNLTFHVGADGESLSIGGPPLPLHHEAPQRTYHGRDLTRHLDPDNKLTCDIYAHAPARHTRPLPARMLAGLMGGLKWLFFVKPRIQIIERYIWREALGFFLVGAMGFTFFMVATTIFSFGEKIFSKQIPPFTIAKILMLSAPQFLVLAIPVAVLFSTLMAMGRLNRDNEIIALTTNGVSLYRIFVPYIAIAIMSGLLTWTIYEHVVPPNMTEQRETLKTFWEAQVVDFIKPGIVIKAPNRKYFYVEEISKAEGIMYGLRLYDYYDEQGSLRQFPRIFRAERAWVKDSFLVLSDVTFYELDQTHADTLVEARMPEVRIDIATQLADYPVRRSADEMTALELRARVSRDRDRMASIPYHNRQLAQVVNKDWTAYYFKYSVPLACLAFVLVAVPVSLRGPRDERNMGIILSFMLVMVYYIIFFTCREVGGRGLYIQQDFELFGHTLARAGSNLFPPLIAGWLAPALFMLASTVLIARARR